MSAVFEPSRAHTAPSAVRVSVVMCTYNRGALLRGAVDSVLAQTDPLTPPFELVVVDNNSTDRTREIVEQIAAEDSRVRYVFEPAQGLSSARNAGIREARGELIAFIDDDLRAAPDWIAAIARALDEHPDVDVVGGRVLPIWSAVPPGWLTSDHWAPLALADHGAAPLLVSIERPICLVGAGGCRRTVFDAVGRFETEFQRVKEAIGSLEDHEFILRVLRTGRKGLYDPRIAVHAAVQPDRLERSYHRRWHHGHGHFHALLRSEHVERTAVGTLFGVPAHVYRQAIVDAWCWLRSMATGRRDRAFVHELRLRFFLGFFRTRRRQFFQQPRHRRPDELRRLLRRPARRRAAPTGMAGIE